MKPSEYKDVQHSVFAFTLFLIFVLIGFPYIANYAFEAFNPREISCEADNAAAMIEKLKETTAPLRAGIEAFHARYGRLPRPSEINRNLLDTTCGLFYLSSSGKGELCFAIGNYISEGTYIWRCSESDLKGRWSVDD